MNAVETTGTVETTVAAVAPNPKRQLVYWYWLWGTYKSGTSMRVAEGLGRV